MTATDSGAEVPRRRLEAVSAQIDRPGERGGLDTGHPPALAVREVSKRFGDVIANDRLELQLLAGRVHGLLGENGAGKSTIIKMLGGIYRPDEGEIVVQGRSASLGSPYDASQMGIEIVHQESILIPALTIAENIALRRRIKGRMGGAILADFRRVADEFGFELDPQSRVADLTIGARQRADIVIAMMASPSILILDEPTPIMGTDERRAFFSLVRELAGRGAAVVLVTHRLREAIEQCDDITVLRDGRVTGSWLSGGLPSEAQILEAMVGAGGELASLPESAGTTGSRRDGPPALSARQVRLNASERLVIEIDDFEAWAGEIVGIAGIEGSGQRELACLLVGQLKPDSGAVSILGRPTSDYAERDLCALIGDVPDEPLLGTAGNLPIWQNLAFPTLLWDTVGPRRRRQLAARADESIARFRIKAPNGKTPVDHLSGGNKRRVVLAREIHVKSPDVLVTTYATRGLDARSGSEVMRHVAGLAARGVAVVFISSDMDELLGLCHRVAVLVDGRLGAPVETSKLDHLRLASQMLGLGSELATGRAANDERNPS